MSKLAAIYGATLPIVDDWRQQAACVGKDPELWFATGRDQQDRMQQAVAICMHCPVRRECLNDALDSDERHGIRGGMDMEVSRNRKSGPWPTTIEHGTVDGAGAHRARKERLCDPCRKASSEHRALIKAVREAGGDEHSIRVTKKPRHEFRPPPRTARIHDPAFIAACHELREAGATYRQIAESVGASRTSVITACQKALDGALAGLDGASTSSAGRHEPSRALRGEVAS